MVEKLTRRPFCELEKALQTDLVKGDVIFIFNDKGDVVSGHYGGDYKPEVDLKEVGAEYLSLDIGGYTPLNRIEIWAGVPHIFLSYQAIRNPECVLEAGSPFTNFAGFGKPVSYAAVRV
ncbi:hypothetical protein KA107_01245 [Candidatus Pacearchaeota archaeon]|nr:hypothetical protein [Candidatus Pacearchaeota archaeon]